MTISSNRGMTFLAELLEHQGMKDLAKRLRPKTCALPEKALNRPEICEKLVRQRWEILQAASDSRGELLDAHTISQMSAYRNNIEGFVGTVKVPVGIVGPLRVNGLFAEGDYYVPVATSEATLVASFNRGAALIGEVGGSSAMLISEGVGRSPGFSFSKLEEVAKFIQWIACNTDKIAVTANATSRYCRLLEISHAVDGNNVYLLMEYSTGDAAGQNMVTFATAAATEWIVEHSPVKPRSWYLECNYSGDKKATSQSLFRGRGKKVAAEVTLPAGLVKRYLHVTPSQIADCSHMGLMGGVLAGSLGVQSHYANGLAALFIACGQDAACVAEAAIGTTRMELTTEGELYASVTLPNLIVGTVGGGTKLPSQRACLEILGLAGPGNARAFAEVAACLCLAGELSIIGAICAHEFSRAHARLARGRNNAD